MASSDDGQYIYRCHSDCENKVDQLMRGKKSVKLSKRNTTSAIITYDYEKSVNKI